MSDYIRELPNKLGQGLADLCAKIINSANASELARLRTPESRATFDRRLGKLLDKEQWSQKDLLEIAGLCIALYLHSYALESEP